MGPEQPWLEGQQPSSSDHSLSPALEESAPASRSQLQGGLASARRTGQLWNVCVGGRRIVEGSHAVNVGASLMGSRQSDLATSMSKDSNR